MDTTRSLCRLVLLRRVDSCADHPEDGPRVPGGGDPSSGRHGGARMDLDFDNGGDGPFDNGLHPAPAQQRWSQCGHAVTCMHEY